MSQSAVAAFAKAGAGDALSSTRANYERFALLLVSSGQLPGLSLAHLDFRVLLFLLGQKPGHYAAHQHTIAKACNSNTTSVRQSLSRLRDAGLVLWKVIPPHHPLPTGRFARTNVCHYQVDLPRLAALLFPTSRARSTPANPDASTHPISDASTLPNSDASYGKDLRSEQKPLPPPPPQATLAPSPPLPEAEEEAAVPIQDSPDLESIRQSWQKLALGDFDHRSRRALENRLSEGANVEQLHAAVAGASSDDWLRRRAKSPFAVVFASLASIERFAHHGRKLLAQTPSTSPAPAPFPEARWEEEPAAAPHRDIEAIDESRLNAEELRRSLPLLTPPAVDVSSSLAEGHSQAPAAAQASPALVKAVWRAPRPAEHASQRTASPRQAEQRACPPPDLSSLLQILSSSRRLPSERRDLDSPLERRALEQDEFDRRRIELVAALRGFDEGQLGCPLRGSADSRTP